jgi:DNA excision repair protein ERCC-4
MPVILIDTREQLPYSFKTESRTARLETGDYSLLGAENRVGIERKTLGDLVGSLSCGRERFEKELARARGFEYFAIIIESSFSELAGGVYRSNMNPRAAVQSLLTFSIRYGLPVFFAGSRENGSEITESLLLKYARECVKRAEVVG